MQVWKRARWNHGRDKPTSGEGRMEATTSQQAEIKNAREFNFFLLCINRSKHSTVGRGPPLVGRLPALGSNTRSLAPDA